MTAAVEKRPRSDGTLSSCVVCGTRLPLRLPRQGEVGQEWECAGCGTAFRAMLVDDPSPDLLRNVRCQEPPAAVDAEVAGDDSKSRWAARCADYRPQGEATTAPPARSGVRVSVETNLSRTLDREVQAQTATPFRPRGPAFAQHIVKPGSVPYDADLQQQVVAGLEQTSEEIDQMFAEVCHGELAALRDVETIARGTLYQVSQDVDLFVGLGINVPKGEYPSRHSVHTGMLAVAVGASLGWDARTLADLNIGCLLHDLGMLRVQDRFRDGRMLPLADFSSIATHPLHTLEMLEDHLDHIPAVARCVAYQMHERCNGTGYPRGVKLQAIHPLARVAAVADTYVALTSDRPHRPALMPYHAMEIILRGVKDGLFDPVAVRALLKTVSLFPIGSFVALNNGGLGRVLRANGDAFVRPIIELYGPSGRGDPSVIDLAQEPSLHVTRAVSRLER